MAEVDENQEEVQRVQQFIAAEVEKNKDAIIAAYAKQAPATAQTTVDQQQQAQRELQATLDPFIRPSLDLATFRANDAKDYVDFYTSNPDAVGDKAQIEQHFQEAAKNGRPMSRQAIADWMDG